MATPELVTTPSNEKVNNTNIIDKVKNLKPGSFDTSTLTGSIIPESIGNFDTSSLTGDIIPESIGSFDTSTYLPEGLNLTPKIKFNLPVKEGDQ